MTTVFHVSWILKGKIVNSFGAIAASLLSFRSLACARFSECRYAAKTRSGENNLDARDLGIMEAAVEKKKCRICDPCTLLPRSLEQAIFPPTRVVSNSDKFTFPIFSF